MPFRFLLVESRGKPALTLHEKSPRNLWDPLQQNIISRELASADPQLDYLWLQKEAYHKSGTDNDLILRSIIIISFRNL